MMHRIFKTLKHCRPGSRIYNYGYIASKSAGQQASSGIRHGAFGAHLLAAALVYNIFQEDDQDTVSSAIKCHGFHGHNEDEELRRRLAKLENQVEKLASVLKTQHNVQQTTGQGEAIFSWDKRFIVMSGLICQWGHLAIMDAKFRGILMADWAMDFRATIPYLICIVGSICAVFAFTFYEIHSLSKKYDTGVAMVVKED